MNKCPNRPIGEKKSKNIVHRTSNTNEVSYDSFPSADDYSGNLVPCAICGRKFSSDRIAKHQGICRKVNTKKVKPKTQIKSKPKYQTYRSILILFRRNKTSICMETTK